MGEAKERSQPPAPVERYPSTIWELTTPAFEKCGGNLGRRPHSFLLRLTPPVDLGESSEDDLCIKGGVIRRLGTSSKLNTHLYIHSRPQPLPIPRSVHHPQEALCDEGAQIVGTIRQGLQDDAKTRRVREEWKVADYCLTRHRMGGEGSASLT